MPPKLVYSHEKIIAAALAIARRDGVSAITARSIGKELGCSVKPIFTSFGSMKEAMAGTIKEAKNLFVAYMEKPYEKTSFMRVGLRWIQFAREEPKLYQMLFMPINESASALSPQEIFRNFAGLTDRVLPIIQNEFALSEEYSLKLYNQMILHVHGIACLLVAGETDFTEQNIRSIFTDAVMGLVMYYKAEGGGVKQEGRS